MFVVVRLVKPWAGQPAGTMLSLPALRAEQLIQRRKAERVLPPETERAVTGPAETRG